MKLKSLTIAMLLAFSTPSIAQDVLTGQLTDQLSFSPIVRIFVAAQHVDAYKHNYNQSFNLSSDGSAIGAKINYAVKPDLNVGVVYSLGADFDSATSATAPYKDKNGTTQGNQYLYLQSQQYGLLKLGRNDSLTFEVNGLSPTNLNGIFPGNTKFTTAWLRYMGSSATYKLPLLKVGSGALSFAGQIVSSGSEAQWTYNNQEGANNRPGYATSVTYKSDLIDLGAAYQNNIFGVDGYIFGGALKTHGFKIGALYSNASFTQSINLAGAHLPDNKTVTGSIMYNFNPEWFASFDYQNAKGIQGTAWIGGHTQAIPSIASSGISVDANVYSYQVGYRFSKNFQIRGAYHHWDYDSATTDAIPGLKNEDYVGLHFVLAINPAEIQPHF